MNSSVTPDKVRGEHEFRDYLFATRTINTLKSLTKENKYFMLSIGFKNPHLALHVPHRYYEMYKNLTEHWKLTKRELRFPYLASTGGYRCCAEGTFDYMNEEGAKRNVKSIPLGNINHGIPLSMHNELMAGYCGMVTYVDTQLGRLLDAVDELQLWNNLTIVLTADHGMHNGEKGLWEKWTLFDEATRVPLFIYHPKSPFKGQHYKKPVELIDIFPTVNDLTQAPFDREKLCTKDVVCKELQGKSLAPVVLGDLWAKSGGQGVANNEMHGTLDSILLPRNFSISQVWKCVNQDQYIAAKKLAATKVRTRANIWRDCDRGKADPNEISAMGYSLRTNDFRYTAWLRMNRETMVPYWDMLPLEEDLFDHRNETYADFTHQETENIARKPENEAIISSLRQMLMQYLQNEVVYRGPF